MQIKLKIAIILLLICTIIGYNVYKRYGTLDNSNIDITETDKDVIESNEVQTYFEVFIRILGDPYSIVDTGINKELISDTLYKEIEDRVNENKGNEVPGSEYSDFDTMDSDREQCSDGEFPIIDQYGVAYKYGSKEESDFSFESYRKLPSYELLSFDIRGNRLRVKFFDRLAVQVSIYDIYIDKNKKIESYRIM